MNQVGGFWENLPELVLTDIYKLLDTNDRLAASSTCKQWRNVLFQSCFWTAVRYDTARKNLFRNEFIIEKSAHLYDRIEVYLDSGYNVAQTKKLFKRLTHSKCLRTLILRIFACDHRSYIPSGAQELHIAETFIAPILEIVQNAPIRVLDFGCYEHLALFSAKVLSHISQPQLITKIGFATIKKNPSDYPVGELYQVKQLRALTNLQMISLDYDLLNESILCNLNRLKRLVIHVHGVEINHKGIPEKTWENFRNRNPYVHVRMTLINALEAVEILHTEILRPSIPLSHLRVFFCNKINRSSLEFISTHYKNSLKSIVWVDDVSDPDEDMDIDGIDAELDPFVMMSWMCKKLSDIVVLGHNMEIDSVIAMARLRGPALRRLQVGNECLKVITNKQLRAEVVQSVENVLERNWDPAGDPLYRAMCNSHNLMHKNFYRNKFIYSHVRNDLVLTRRKCGVYYNNQEGSLLILSSKST